MKTVAPRTLIVGWLEFAVAEDKDIRTSDLDVECLGYLHCKILGSSAGEKLEFVFVLHLIEGLRSIFF